MAKWERFIVYPLLFVALFLGSVQDEKVLDAAEGDSVGESPIKRLAERLDATEGVVEEIRAKRMVVVGEDGTEQVVLEAGSRGGQVNTYSNAGTLAAGLWAERDGARLLVFNEAGTTGRLSVVGAEMDIWARAIGVRGEGGKTAVFLSASPDGGLLEILNNEETLAGSFWAAPNGGFLAINNGRGDRRVLVGQTTTDHGGIWVYDKYGEDSRFYGHR